MSAPVGVLALQGDFANHASALARAGAQPRWVRSCADLDGLGGLVLPGGESTVIGQLLFESGLGGAIRARAAGGLPLLGTCAGAILLAREIRCPPARGLGLLDVSVERNAYGRQRESFRARLAVAGPPFEGIFIRAPRIAELGPQVEVLARLGTSPVWVREGARMACTFHPELDADPRVLRAFLELVARAA